jgi:GNAT superfamily N-acetyltransferase
MERTVAEKPVIRKATDAEIDILLGIWLDKEKSLEKKGIAVWDIRQFTKENLGRKYSAPEYCIGTLEGDAFGGFILLEEDLHFWPGRQEDNAYYFHKFVIRDKYSGMGLSKAILDWVKDRGRENGKDFIRLDFNENRDYLKKLYYGNGFERVGIASEDEENRIVLAEYRITRD